MIETLKTNNIQPILMTLPTVVTQEMNRDDLNRQNVFFPYYAGTYSVGRFLSLHRAYNRVIRIVGAEYHVPVVEMEPVFDSRDKNALFWDTMHPNEKGNRLIAETLSRKIQEINLH
jgi:lysophospholipase L1-like esterase